MRFLSHARVLLAVAVAMVVSGSVHTVAAQATGTVSGRVVEQGTLRPLAAVQVFVVGTGRGALTNAAGEYMILNVPAGAQRVRTEAIGFSSQERPAAVTVGQMTRVDFEVGQSAISLDAIVVTGTAGATQQRTLGNVVSSIDAASITDAAPIRTAAELLQGRTPGLTLYQPSGTPGTAANVKIRGAGSLSAGNQPVYYVDGVRMTGGSQGGWSVSGQSTSALDAINPDDIESIEVIKGPAAATLYGADAAAGVIQIITKKGRRGQQGMTWNAKMEFGQSAWGSHYPTQWAQCTPARIRVADSRVATNTAWRAGDFPRCAGVDSLLPLDQRLLSSTLLRDDPRALRKGEVQGYTLSTRGGGENFSFFISGDRSQEQGIFHNSDFERTSGRANFTVAPRENLDINISTGYTRSWTRLPNNDNSSWGMLRNIVRSPAGRIGTQLEEGYLGLGPDQVNRYDNRTRAERALFGATVNYNPTPFFRNRLTTGLDWNQRLATLFFEIDRSPTPAYGTTNARGFIGQFAPNTRNWTFDYAGTLSFTPLQDISTETSFGMQLNAYRFESLQANGTGLVSNSVRLVSNAEEKNAFETFSEQNSLGFFVQQQVGWMNRLFVTGALRFDDNSAFGSEFNRVIYPKAQVSWVVSEEPFFDLPMIDQLRLRGAWGRAGNSPAPFAADRTWGTSTVVMEDGAGAGGLAASAYGNPNLRAETGQELELGFDASLLQNRVGLEVTYYYQQTKDALLNVPVAPSSGFTGGVLQNVGEIRNNGLELSLFGSPITMPNLTWDARLGMSLTKNELVSFGGVRDEPIATGYRGTQRHMEGYPLGVYYGYPVLRDAQGNLVKLANGFAALDSANLTYIGPSAPTRELSLTNTLRIMRNLSLYSFMDYKGGHYAFNMSGQTADWDMVSWHVVNPNRDPDDYAIRQSNSNMHHIEKADFIKLRELSLTYSLPQTMARRAGASTMSVTLAGRNLATWTSYSGLDPEGNIEGAHDFIRAESNSVPPTRRWVATFNVNF
jgi:TonB-dependent starch-binding outer membrane protein SusC